MNKNILSLLLMIFFITSCGQKGPLTLPNQQMNAGSLQHGSL